MKTADQYAATLGLSVLGVSFSILAIHPSTTAGMVLAVGPYLILLPIWRRFPFWSLVYVFAVALIDALFFATSMMPGLGQWQMALSLVLTLKLLIAALVASLAALARRVFER